MKILLKTEVAGNVKSVFERFDNQLLLALNPPWVKMKFVQVDPPTKVGAIIHIKVWFLGIFKQEWKNFVSEYSTGQTESFFVDEGEKMPSVLRYWRHKHIVRQKGNHVEIVDDIQFTPPFALLGWMMYPVLWFQFYYRKPIYRKIFGKP